MTRRGGRALAVAAVVAGVLPWALRRPPAAAPAAVRPSVLLVTVDTLRADHVGAYGARTVKTPHIDALAREGVVFEEAVASAPLTLVSHATILSGLEPPRHGVRDNGVFVLGESVPTLATVLRGAGYATGAFVGAFVLDRRFGLARGFDVYDDRVERRTSGGSVLESERPGAEVADAARAWMRRQAGPFFAWVHLYDPHAPYAPPPAFATAAGGAYAGEVTYADDCVGRVLAAFRARAGQDGLAVLTADHGEGLGEHGETTHGLFVYESTLRVPLVLSGNGIVPARHRGLARTADIAPTIAARLGVSLPGRLDGVDLLGGARGREAYAETFYPRTLGWAGLQALRLGSLKYIAAPRPELYDLATDPGETRDLAAARPQDAARLAAALSAHAAPAAAAAADPEVAERLRALGYVAAGGDTPKAAQRDPKDAAPLWRRFEEATAAEARGDRDGALRLLRALVKDDPGNAAFRRTLASALRRSGRSTEAVALVDASEATDALTLHERALALAAAGRPEEALAVAREAAAGARDLPEAHNHLGVLEARAGRSVEALAAFDTALRLDPNDARAWNNRGNVLRDLGRAAEAAESYRKAVDLAPRDPDAHNGLGVLAVLANDNDAAAAAFRKVLELDPRYGDALLNLAVVELRRGRPTEARRHLDALLARDPRSAAAARGRELRRQLGGRPATAVVNRPGASRTP